VEGEALIAGAEEDEFAVFCEVGELERAVYLVDSRVDQQ
jgi:hypothetical protein